MSSVESPSQPKPFRILLIGAAGNFGARLARLLTREAGVALVLAGRKRASLEAIAKEIGGGETAVLDRSKLDAAQLGSLGVDLVIDASGPFQTAQTNVIEAAIGAGVHYVDLADCRRFVGSIRDFEDAARQARVAIISGASSTPALSNAVLDVMVSDWQWVDSIDITISPSNRQRRGPAVVAAILSGIGRRFRLFAEGGWRDARGWGDLRRVSLPKVGRRWASLCEVPDNDLLVERFAPRASARFFASLELPIMHLSLWLLSGLVRVGAIRSLLPLAKPLGRLADLLQPIGNDMGGMLVEAKGADPGGAAITQRWWLAAKGDIGPNVPVLATLAVARKLRDRTLPLVGAHPCAGLVSLTDFEGDFASLGIETGWETVPQPNPIFETALGRDVFAMLPTVTSALHQPSPTGVWCGEGSAEAGTNGFARLLASLFNLPGRAANVPIRVIIDGQADGSERWARVWPDGTMRSVMSHPGRGDGRIEEHFGPFAFVLKLGGHSHGIDMKLIGARGFGVPIPRMLLPRIVASERAEGERHLFDVEISLPLVGSLVHYQGWLAAAKSAA